MSYNNYYMRLRVKAVQEFDRMYHEPNTRPNATNGSGSGSDATSSAFRIRVIWII